MYNRNIIDIMLAITDNKSLVLKQFLLSEYIMQITDELHILLAETENAG